MPDKLVDRIAILVLTPNAIRSHHLKDSKRFTPALPYVLA